MFNIHLFSLFHVFAYDYIIYA